MEHVAFGELGLHHMSHSWGIWLARVDSPRGQVCVPIPVCPAEFGLMCPVNPSDTAADVMARYGSPELKSTLLPQMLAENLATL